MFREIRQSGEIFELLPAVWAAEQAMPRWYRAASSTWTRSLEDWAHFADGCRFAYLFDAAAIVFLEEVGSGVLEIHLAVIGELDKDRFAAACAELRDRLFHAGHTQIRGWVMRRNLALRRLLASVGFERSGLRMETGESHGRPLTWDMMEVSR